MAAHDGKSKADGAVPGAPIDRAEYERRLARMSALLGEMVRHAQQHSLTRCPYKDRFDRCTAAFACRNQRRSAEPGGRLRCAGDDRLDHRSAWEVQAGAQVALPGAGTLPGAAAGGESAPMSGFVRHGDQRCPARAGTTLFDCADELRLAVPSTCGRSGHCRECVVEVRRGTADLSARSAAESFLRDDFRLACQAVVQGDGADIEFALPRRVPRILTARPPRSIELDPAVRRRADQVYYLDEPIDAYRGHMYGLAVDVGTTTVVAELVDLESGAPLYQIACENPQRFGGSDVMHRISYDGGPHHGELRRALVRTLNHEIHAMCESLGVLHREIYELVVVGNATMRDLFLGLDVQPIGERPYRSVTEQEYRAGRRASTAVTIAARTLGLRASRNARVFAAPLVACHVGGDVAADLLAIDMAAQDELVMLVDVGTNTEVVLGHKGRLLAASCPAGPAFEGGSISCGMTGCEGAIEWIRHAGNGPDGPRFEWRTIGGGPPRGICGSGLIDLLAELVRHGLMTPKGVFAGRASQFTIVPEQGIVFTRRDASELAQAKAANSCGQAILMRRLGVGPADIRRLYLAGGFANYVDPASAIDIGFLAAVPADRIVKVGNAAAQGAREMLLSRARRAAIEQLIARIEHVELETSPDFFELFVEGCQMKPLRPAADPARP